MADAALEAVGAQSPALWTQANGIVTENGKPLEFGRHRFLIDPYEDEHPDQVIRKSAQAGWSTLAILKSFWLAKYRELNIGHTLPTQNVRSDFVFPKVNPLIAKNPAIAALVTK